MTLSTAWNAAEDDALQGAPWAAQLLYLRGFRRYMDYTTGLVGVRRKVSWQGLREVLHVPCHQGLKEVALDKDQLRRAVRWLEKCGLVEVRTEGKQLIFFLPLADLDESVSKKAAPRPHHVRTIKAAAKPATKDEPKATPPIDSSGASSDEKDAPNAASIAAPNSAPRPHHGEVQKAAPHPVSGKPVNPYPPQAAATPVNEGGVDEAVAALWSAKKVDVDADEQVSRRAVALAVVVRQMGGAVTASDPRVRQWAASGVTEDQVAEAMRRAKARREEEGSAQPIAAGFLDALLRDVLNPPKPKAPPWWGSVAAMEAKAREVGIAGARPGEEIDAFKARILGAVRRIEGGAAA